MPLLHVASRGWGVQSPSAPPPSCFETKTAQKQKLTTERRHIPKGRMAEWLGEDTQACATPAVAVAIEGKTRTNYNMT
jgi:hypothetical protein